MDIICPKCSGKASFCRYKYIKDDIPNKGEVICASCGLNKIHVFTSKDYYYSIPIGKRYLYAINLENLKFLLTYFKENRRMKEPDRDFPKEFYINRLEIIKKIQKRLDKEKK